MFLTTYNKTITSYSDVGNPYAVRPQSVDATPGGMGIYPNRQGILVGRHVVPAGKQLEIINIALHAECGQLTTAQPSSGASQVFADYGTALIEINGANAFETRLQQTDLFWLDPQGQYSTGGNRWRCQMPYRNGFEFPGITLTSGQSIRLLWRPAAAAPGGQTGVEVNGHRVSGSIFHSRGITSGAIAPYDTTTPVVICAYTAPVGGVTLQSCTLFAEMCSAPVFVTLTVDGRPLWNGPVFSNGKQKQKNLRCGCTGLKLYPGQTIECWANAMFPNGQRVGMQIAGDLVDFGSDLFTDPGVSNVLVGVDYKNNSATNNRTGTVTLPTTGNVKTGITYGASLGQTGTYDGSDRWTDPGVANVLAGVDYKANSTSNNRTGTVTLPGVGNVKSGVTFGPSLSLTGTYDPVVPLADVKLAAETVNINPAAPAPSDPPTATDYLYAVLSGVLS
jgi:hypothetical protein